MLIPRKLKNQLKKTLQETNKGVVVYGARQVGKTTLIKGLLDELAWSYVVVDGDRRGKNWEWLVSRELQKIKWVIGDKKVLFLDEAQRVPEIGLIAKIVIDHLPQVKLILTGSSALNLASKVSEPLTGRVFNYRLYPIWQGELVKIKSRAELEEELEERLIFGSYPEVFRYASWEGKIEYLENLVGGYLYKDLFEFGGVKGAEKIYQLTRLLALQIGSQMSVNELANELGLARVTVEKYLDLLEKSMVIFRLGGWRRNLRREIKKMKKVYFWDLGVRNGVLGDFRRLEVRGDVGQLWENWLIGERLKRLRYERRRTREFYWRMVGGSEIDWVEEEEGELRGYEFKWNERKKVKPPKAWSERYKEASFEVINRENWWGFVV